MRYALSFGLSCVLWNAMALIGLFLCAPAGLLQAAERGEAADSDTRPPAVILRPASTVDPQTIEVSSRIVTAQSCVWTFSPPEPEFVESDSLHSADRIPTWAQCGWRTGSGAKQPVRVFYVVLPPGSTPMLTISGVTTAPSRYGMAQSTSSDQDSLPALVGWAEITRIESWRGFRFARVEVALQRGSHTAATLLSSVQLRVDFSGSSGELAPRDRDSKMLADIAANGTIASRWWRDGDSGGARLRSALDAWPEFPLYRLTLEETGVYSISGSQLRSRGVQLSGSPSAKIKLFGNGGRLLNNLTSALPDEVLKENAIRVEDGGDNVFDDADLIIFYGTGLKGYDYCAQSYLNDVAHQSPFSTENVYFVGVDETGPDGLRMAPISTGNGSSVLQQTSAAFEYVESEVFIRGPSDQPESGLIWMMSTLAAGEDRTFSINLSAATGAAGRLNFVGSSYGSPGSLFDIYLNGEQVFDGTYNSYLYIDVPAGTIVPGNNVVRFVNGSTATVYLNYFECEFIRELSTANGTLHFVAPAATGYFRYEIGNLNSQSFILDVTDPLRPRLSTGPVLTDSSYQSGPRRYFASNRDRFRTPLVRGAVSHGTADYTSLRDPANSARMVMITYDDWFDELAPLKEFHETYREEPMPGLVKRVRLGDIYDEFAWGVRDPVAIRNFLKYAFEHWRGPDGAAEPLKYVLFVGDGDYDYRNLESNADRNWMPPWEDTNKCTDAFFVKFGNSALPELITGRFPVQSDAELAAIIDKTIAYANEPLYGPWKNTATFAADDEWKNGVPAESVHTLQAETLVNQVLPRYFTFRKAYECLYPFRVSAQGRFKPDATRDLIDIINRGTLLVNFQGHGNARIWTDEQLFVMDRDMDLLDNYRTWPVFVAATCSWGLYDAPIGRCFPELLLSDPVDGAIACIAATRFTGSNQNQALAASFYRDIFRQGLASRRSLGESLWTAHGPYTNNDLYHVLGDPALRLASPEYFVRVTEASDSIQALSIFEMHGIVSRDSGGERWSTFQGVVEARVFDTEDSLLYLWGGGGWGSSYIILPGNSIFRGTASIVNGEFTVRFRVPRDVRYGGNNAKISLYFFGKDSLSADSADGIGIQDHLLIASAAAAETDTVPPRIQAWLETPSFRSGDLVSPSPKLIVGLADSSGINLSGEVGHRVTVRLDDAQVDDLTPFFNYDRDSYTTGMLERSLGPLATGSHTMLIEAWDSFNNLNQIELSFTVGESGEAGYQITDVLNWPNPMSGSTNFTYYLTQAGTRSVSLKVFTLSGKCVFEQRGLGTRGPAFNSNADLPWDGRDREGHLLGNGVYFYRVRAEHEDGQSAEATGKLVILR
ncbi:type IX secretion system sortase PorU [candidate division KSB1 bacterium]|nr:type IX secretion system sortase PorU [candidate division KSB1 bacterium]